MCQPAETQIVKKLTSTLNVVLSSLLVYGRKDPKVLDIDQPLVRDLPFRAGGERQEGQVHEGLVNRTGELRPRSLQIGRAHV